MGGVLEIGKTYHHLKYLKENDRHKFSRGSFGNSGNMGYKWLENLLKSISIYWTETAMVRCIVIILQYA